MEWYALQVTTGRENSVQARVLEQLERKGASKYVSEVAVPSMVVIEIKDNQRVERQQRLMPGYILVHADWIKAGVALLAVNGVRGFVGQGEDPAPMDAKEVSKLLGRQSKTVDPETAPVKIGQQVRITSGPLCDFEGEVTQIDLRAQQATVTVQIFGRATPAQIQWRHLKAQH